VGESGVQRIVQRTCELMREHRTEDVRKHGGIDLATIQKYINLHCSVSLDLFGSEVSTNAANFYTMGLKGRFEEMKKGDDHTLKGATYSVADLAGDRIGTREEAALVSLNERLRDDYVADCQRGVNRWNQVIRSHGIDVELRLPHRAFRRAIGSFADVKVSPDGRVLSEAEWDARHHDWLPTAEDQAFVGSLMQPVTASRAGSRPRPAASTASRSSSSTCAWAEPATMAPRAVTSKELGPTLGMYSPGMVAPTGEIVVVAGQVGMDGGGRLVGPGDVAAQTRQTFANIEKVLRAAGCGMRDVVRFQTFLTYASDIDHFMRARREVFPGYFPDGVYPPNTLLVVSRLVQPELLVEIEAMAVKTAKVAAPAARPRAGARTRGSAKTRASGRSRQGRKGR